MTSVPSSSPAWSVFSSLAGAFVALGFAITGPLHAPVGHWDATVARWFFEQRTSGGNFWSAVGTWLAETPVVVGLGVVTALTLAYRRRWHEVTLVVGGLLVEISVYLIVVLTVDRPRPGHRLETRMTGSYPSGHVAASIVLYGLLAFVLTRRVRSAVGRTRPCGPSPSWSRSWSRCPGCTGRCTISVTSSRAR